MWSLLLIVWRQCLETSAQIRNKHARSCTNEG